MWFRAAISPCIALSLLSAPAAFAQDQTGTNAKKKTTTSTSKKSGSGGSQAGGTSSGSGASSY
jgi:hypothetical protein